MPRTYTSTEIETMIRSETGLTGSTAVTTAQILSWIDTYYAELYDLCVEAHGHAMYATSDTFVTVANQTDYTIPTLGHDFADIYIILGVDLDLGGGDVISLDPFDFHSRNVGRSTSPWRSKLTKPMYRWHGGTFKLVPAPDAVYTVTIHYVPVCSKVVTGAEVINGVDGWERYIVVCACAAIANAEETDPSFWLAEKASLKQRIEALAKQRVADGPDRIVRRRQRRAYAYGDD